MNHRTISRRIAIGAYLSAIAFVIAHTTNAFVAAALNDVPDFPVTARGAVELTTLVETPQQSSDIIVRSGLFLLPHSPEGLTGGTPFAPPAPPLEIGKKLALLGTVHGKNGGFMAVLEDIATKQQSLYRLGTEIPNAATLAVIEKNRVLFREGAQEEWLEIAVAKPSQGERVEHRAPSATPAPSVLSTPQRRVVDRRVITEALSDPTRLLTQAQAVPFLTNGKLDGFQLANVMPKGFFDKIGLQTNDILQRINGVELRDPSMVLTLMQQLRNERTVRVDLLRRNQPQILTYEIR